MIIKNDKRVNLVHAAIVLMCMSARQWVARHCISIARSKLISMMVATKFSLIKVSGE